MRRRGHTLLELLASLGLLTVLAAVCAAMLATARADDDAARQQADAVRHVRNAADLLAAQVRAAREVVPLENGVRIDGRLWRVRGDVLSVDGQPTLHGVARLVVQPTGDGVFRVAVVPAAGRDGARAQALSVLVRQRVCGLL